MVKSKEDPQETTNELLQTLITLQLYQLGANQAKIAKIIGRQKLWVSNILKELPKRDQPHA